MAALLHVAFYDQTVVQHAPLKLLVVNAQKLRDFRNNVGLDQSRFAVDGAFLESNFAEDQDRSENLVSRLERVLRDVERQQGLLEVLKLCSIAQRI